MGIMGLTSVVGFKKLVAKGFKGFSLGNALKNRIVHFGYRKGKFSEIQSWIVLLYFGIQGFKNVAQICPS